MDHDDDDGAAKRLPPPPPPPPPAHEDSDPGTQRLLARASALGALYQQHRQQQQQSAEAAAAKGSGSRRKERERRRGTGEGAGGSGGNSSRDSSRERGDKGGSGSSSTTGGGGGKGQKKKKGDPSSLSKGGGGGRKRPTSPLLLQRPASLADSTARHAIPVPPTTPSADSAGRGGKGGGGDDRKAGGRAGSKQQQQQQDEEAAAEMPLDPEAAALVALERVFAGKLKRAMTLLLCPPQASAAAAGAPQGGKRSKKKAAAATTPVAPPSPSAVEAQQAEAWAALSEARGALAEAYRERLLRARAEGEGSQGLLLAQRLWLCYYREVEALQSQLSQPAQELTCPEAERRSRAAGKARLEAVLLEAAGALTAALPPGDGAEDTEQQAAAATAVLMVALGDVARYASRLAAAGASGPPRPETEWGGGAAGAAEAAAVAAHCLVEARAWYGRAAGVRPGWGRTYNQLGILAVMEGEASSGGSCGQQPPLPLEAALAAAVEYTRALLAAAEPFPVARDNLVALLDRWRRAADAAAALEASGGGSGGGSGGKGGGAAAASIDELFARSASRSIGGGSIGGGISGSGSGSGSGTGLKRARAAAERAAAGRALLRALHMIHARVDLDVAPAEARRLGRCLALYAGAVGSSSSSSNEAAVAALRTLCCQAAVLAAGALADRAAAARGLLRGEDGEEGEGEGERKKLPYDVRAALALVMELGLALAGAGEAAEGWDPGRGPALLLLLEWAAANRRWLWRLPGARVGDIVRAAQRRLAHARVSPQALEAAARTGKALPVNAAEARLVLGLRGFLREERPPPPPPAVLALLCYDEAGAAGDEVGVARCRRLLRELEALGALEHPPGPVASAGLADSGGGGVGDGDGLGLSQEMLASLSLSGPPPPPGLPSLPFPPPTTTTTSSCPACQAALEPEVVGTAGGGGVCEFCGHALVQPPADAEAAVAGSSKGGLLVGVDLSQARAAAAAKQEEEAAAAAAVTATPRPGAPPIAPSLLDPFVAGGDTTGAGEGRLVVIDAANVAMRHGRGQAFSCKGVALALDFFRLRGHRAVAFLPETYLDFDRIGALKRASKALGGVRAAQLPDNVQLLRALAEARPAPLLVTTPPQDYDDSYCLRYARAHGGGHGVVVTNDQYRDQLGKIEEKGEREALRRWLKTHLISFTFVGDEFIPNPDFRFPAPDDEAKAAGGSGGSGGVA